MDIATILLIVVLVAIIPLALFVGLVCLGILIWSWKRVGPYFVSFGRWVADWRNIVPLGCLGILAIILIVLVAAILPPELSILRVAILGLLILVGVVFTIVALVVWSVRLVAWLWPRFKREFWNNLQRMWDFVWKGMSGERRAKARRPAKGQQPPPKAAAATEPTTDAGSALIGARAAPRRAPPARRSWLDPSWLWALVWGKPQRAAKKPKSVAKSPESQAQTATAAATTPVRVPAKPKAGLRPLIWRLGLVGPWLQGKTRGRKPKPGAPKKMAETPDKPITPAAPMASQPRPTVTVPAVKPAEAKQKPTVAVRPKPKRSILGAIRGVGRSMVAAVEALRKGFWLGIFWALGKARAGMNYILRLLHLGGRRK